VIQNVDAYGHLIGGDRVPAASGATFDDVDPATARPFATLALGDAQDVDRAVRAARAAQPAWGESDVFDRGRILQRLGELLESHAPELAALEARDVGKPLREAERDVSLAVRTWIYFAGWPTKIRGTTNPADRDVFSYTLREPLGVVGAITPWNFPLLIASWKLAPALACGNGVVHTQARGGDAALRAPARGARARGRDPAGGVERRHR
jgi:acyl-CoA reductase-like NAD-dependent aldehyde dehydrogenase